MNAISITSTSSTLASNDNIASNNNTKNDSNKKKNFDSYDSDYDDDDDDDSVVDFPFIESKWKDNVEIGLIVNWPPVSPPYTLELSTMLPEDSIAPLFDGTQWAGTRVWKAAIVALEYLIQMENDNNNHNNRSYSSLLELGCGLGVPGMLWYCWKQKQRQAQQNQKRNHDDENENDHCRVVLTDQPDLISQLQTNLESNFYNKDIHSDSNHHGQNNKNISAQALSWSKEGILQLLSDYKQQQQQQNSSSSSSSSFYSTSFDICLNCDCIYTPLYGRDSWLALGDVLETIAIESPSTLLVTSVERRNGDGLEEFLQRLTDTGAVEDISLVHKDDCDKHHVIEIYVTKGKEKE